LFVDDDVSLVDVESITIGVDAVFVDSVRDAGDNGACEVFPVLGGDEVEGREGGAER